MSKFFSFILCVNKHQIYIEECMESILSQDFKNQFEVLVCVNGDHAKLREFFSRYQYHIDCGKLTIYETEIQNLSFNLNYLATLSKSEYLVRMDADDVSEVSRLSVLFDRIAKNDYPDIVFSNVSYIDQNSAVCAKSDFSLLENKAFQSLPFKNIINHPSVAIRRDFLYKVGGYLGGFKSEDFDLWLRSKKCGAKILGVPESLIRYRYHSGQTTKSLLTYAEISSYWLREFFLEISFYNLIGLLISLGKVTVVKMKSFIQ